MEHDPPQAVSEAPGRRAGRSQDGRSQNRGWWLGLGFLLLVLILDGARPPQKQISARVLLTGIDAYQGMLSPLLARSGARCRFRPSCSHYGEDAIRHYGAFSGSARAVWRILRCGPWTPPGTLDPAVVESSSGAAERASS